MLGKAFSKIGQFCQWLVDLASGPQVLMFVPAAMLGGFWLVGEEAMIFLALLFPALFALAGMFSGTGPAWGEAMDGETGLAMRGKAEKLLTTTLMAEEQTGRSAAAIALQIDEIEAVESQFGPAAAAKLRRMAADRIASATRDTDIVVRLGEHRFGVAVGPMKRADLETLIQLSARLQSEIAEPFPIDGARVFVTASVGFCLPGRAPSRQGPVMLECAEAALNEALLNGHGMIRAYSPELVRRQIERDEISDEIETALEAGQIVPWFQPQVSTDTGQITGFEALARWEHPTRGIIPAREFLPTLVDKGFENRLSEIILAGSLAALKTWDEAGFDVPTVSVNFGAARLADPKACDKIQWELDRYEIAADRLCVEITEDVIASAHDDVNVNNIVRLADMGCKIDLDNFGTGHASIANIRRFTIHRIKIDKSFVTRVDRDRDQQNMVAAVLTMAERLSLDTIAEGVETTGEHAMLAQLGCGSVQGHTVCRPVSLDSSKAWITQYQAKLPQMPKFSQNQE